MCFTNTSLLSKRLAHCEIGSAAILFAPAYGMAVEIFLYLYNILSGCKASQSRKGIGLL